MVWKKIVYSYLLKFVRKFPIGTVHMLDLMQMLCSAVSEETCSFIDDCVTKKQTLKI